MRIAFSVVFELNFSFIVCRFQPVYNAAIRRQETDRVPFRVRTVDTVAKRAPARFSRPIS